MDQIKTPKSWWYKHSKLDLKVKCCPDPPTHCEDCNPSGDCDSCNTIEGRFVEAVCEYASTCDWCAELTHHVYLSMDPETQLGYCEECVQKKEFPQKIKNRLEVFNE